MQKWIAILLILISVTPNVSAANVCQNLLGGVQMDIPGRGGYLRPFDTVIPLEILIWAEKESQQRNVPVEVLAYQKAVEHLSEEEALKARKKILAGFEKAAEFVAQQNLVEAMKTLDDPELLEGSGFTMPPSLREPIYPNQNHADQERRFSNLLIRGLQNPPMMSAAGFVVIPHRPHMIGTDQQILWACREWIRTATEELGHVAQVLGERVSPEHGYLSKMMGSESSAIRSEILHEGTTKNQTLLPFFRDTFLVNWAHETDIYAYMIEIYGPEFIPWWIGRDSGYSLREHIDKEFAKQGMKDREWRD